MSQLTSSSVGELGSCKRRKDQGVLPFSGDYHPNFDLPKIFLRIQWNQRPFLAIIISGFPKSDVRHPPQGTGYEPLCRRRAPSLLVAFVIVAATLGTSWPPTIPPPAFAKPRNHPSHAPPSELRKEVRAELVPNRPDTLRVPDDVVRTLGIRTAPAQTPTRSRTLVLSGSLVLDTDHLAHVHTRFAGEVIELGTVEEPSQGTDGVGRPAGRSASATGSSRVSSWPSSGAVTSARRRANTSMPSPGCGSTRRPSHA